MRAVKSGEAEGEQDGARACDPCSEFILSDKFAPATLPDVCAPRLRTVDAIERVSRKRFVYVAAPAGSGKTISTLLWIEQAKRSTVWIGLDRYDDVPSVFYKLLATGLYSTQPENAAMRAMLVDPSFSASPVEHAMRLVEAMQRPQRRSAVVFDDFHLIENREIVKSLPSVLRLLPSTFAVLLLSRTPPPNAWRESDAETAPTVLGASELAFSKDEIRQYYNALGRFPTPSEVNKLHTATEGWAIGVAALAKAGPAASLEHGRMLEHYFAEQVWSTWDDDLRAFCLATSIADEFDGELARLLTGRDDAIEVMGGLARTNTFLMRLHGDTYRFHHLFLDFLRQKAECERTDHAELCKRAAEHFRVRGDYTRALRFWLESGEFGGMDTYLVLFLFENNRGSVADYADFLRTLDIDALPDSAYRECPPLRVLAAWFAYLTSQRERFEYHLDELYRALPRIAASDPRFVEFAILAYSVDHRTTIIEKAKRFGFFARFVKRFTPEGLATKIASFTHNLPYPHRSNLDYSAIALEKGGMDLLGRTFSPLLGTEWRYIYPLIPACFDYERNRLSEALSGFESTQAALIPENKEDGRLCVMLMKHVTLWQLGRAAEADSALAELAAYAAGEAPHFLPNLKAYRAKLALFGADEDAARTWLDEYFVTETNRIELVRVFQHFTTARALVVLGRASEAEALIERLLAFGRDFNRPLDAGEAGALKASLLWASGRTDEAAHVLAEALVTLGPYGFVRVVADEGASVVPVLEHLAEQGEPHIRVDGAPNGFGADGAPDSAFVGQVLAAARERAQRFCGMTARFGESEQTVALSPQQKLMVELLSRGMKKPEIAQRTGLSLSTVKSHMGALYQKLGVHSAMDAVLKARELGLVE